MLSNPTSAEQRLFEAIRGGRLGVQFKRQVPIGGRFIVDLLAPEAQLVIEIDGGYHGRRGRADAHRDEVLRRFGYRVMRLDAELVERHLSEAVARIQEQLARLLR
jgi:very-short-patch-repair endonuclease